MIDNKRFCMKIMNSLYKHKSIHKYKWSALNSKTFINCFIPKRKLSEVFLDLRFYRGSDIGSERRKCTMAIQIKNSTETKRHSKKQQYFLEWRNIKTRISQVADDTLRNYKAFTQNKN